MGKKKRGLKIPTDREAEIIEALQANCYSQSAAAKNLGITRQCVGHVAVKYHIPTSTDFWDAVAAKIRELVDSDVAASVILGNTQSAISTRFRRMVEQGKRHAPRHPNRIPVEARGPWPATLMEVANRCGISSKTANIWLAARVASGELVRVKRGLYDIPREEEKSNE